MTPILDASDYPEETNITNWNITMFIGKSIINGPFSIAMLVYQRVMFRYLGPPNYLPLKHGKCTKCTKLMKTYGVKPCQLLISGKHQQIFPWNGDLGHLEPWCQWRWPNPDAKGARNIGHLWWIYHTHTLYINIMIYHDISYIYKCRWGIFLGWCTTIHTWICTTRSSKNTSKREGTQSTLRNGCKMPRFLSPVP